MPEKNIMTIHVGPTGRKVFTDNLEMNQNSSNNVLELFCEGKYEFVQVFYTFPDGKTTYKHHMIPDGYDKDKAAYKFHDNIDKAVTSFVIPNVTANLKVSFIGYYKNDLNQYTPVGINDFLITVIRVNNNEVYDQTYNGSDVVNIWKNINNLNALLVDLNPDYKPTTLEDLKATVQENYNELNTRLNSVPNIEDVYNKETINQMFGTVYKYGGSVDNFSDLPTDLTNEQTGVVINVRNPNGMNYVWTGSEWDALGGFDETKYYKKDYIDEVIRDTQSIAHNETVAVDNKVNTLSATHTSDTTALRNDIAQINAQFSNYYNKSDIDGKVSEVTTSVSDLSTRVDGIETSANNYTDQKVGALTQTFNNYTSTTNSRINQLESKVTSVYTLKGSCTYEELTAKTENSVGDVWNVTDKDSQNYVWTGSEWDTLGSVADFSEYAKTSEVTAQIEAAENRLNGSIETTFNGLNTELQALTATVSTNKTSTETAISNLSNDTVHVNTFEAFKTSNNAAISAVDTRVTNLTSSVNTALTGKANASDVYTKNETDNAISTSINALIDGAPDTLDTLKELADAVNSNKSLVETLNEAITNKQDTLVSGTNIKTVNGVSILGTGNIEISGGTGIDDSTISTSSTYSSSKIDSTYLKAPEGRLDIENGRVNLKNNTNSVYSITNNEVVMELNDDGLRYHDNATNREVNITPYYGASDQNVDPATIKVNGVGLARETDLNKKVSLRGDTMTGNLNAPAFTVDSTKVASGDKPLIDGAINFKYKNTNDEPRNAWLTMLPSGQLQFGSQGAAASEIGTVATQEWVNKKITNAYIYKGSVDTYDALPSDADPGFVYNVRSNGANYAWTGTEWDELGATVNLDAYALKTDLNGKQDKLVSGTNIKTINGDSILGTGNITISSETVGGSVGYYDTITKNTDGTYTINRQTGYLVLDGVKNKFNAKFDNTRNGEYYYNELINYISRPSSPSIIGSIISNTLKTLSADNLYIKNTYGIAVDARGYILVGLTTAIDTLDKANAYLLQNPISIQYKLATATTEKVEKNHYARYNERYILEHNKSEADRSANLVNTFDRSNIPSNSSLYTATLNTDGSYTSTATSDRRAWTYANSDFKLHLTKGTYSFSITGKTISSDSNTGMRVIDSNDSTLCTAHSGNGFKNSFTLTSDTDIGVLIKSYKSTDLKIMLNKGLIALPYQPYNQNKHITNNEAVFLKNEAERSANLWDEITESGTLSGDDGSLENNSARLRSKNFIPISGNTRYIFNSSYVARINFYDDSFNFISTWVNNKRPFVTPSNAHFIKFDINSDYGTTYKNDIILNKGNVALQYQPYEGKVIHEKDLKNNSSNYVTLGYYDTITENSDGTYTITRQTGYRNISTDLIEHGAYRPTQAGHGEYGSDTGIHNLPIAAGSKNFINNLLPVRDNGEVYGGSIGISITENGMCWVNLGDNYTTTEQYREYFSKNNIYVQYKLATATTEKVEEKHYARYNERFILEHNRIEAEKSANVFDINIITIGNGYDYTATATDWIKAIDIPVEPNTTYTASYPIAKYAFNHGNIVSDYNKNTITTGSDTRTLSLFMYVGDYSGTVNAWFSNYMLNEGPIALPYQPYEGKVLHEKDLKKVSTTLGHYDTITENADGTYTITKQTGYINGKDFLNRSVNGVGNPYVTFEHVKANKNIENIIGNCSRVGPDSWWNSTFTQVTITYDGNYDFLIILLPNGTAENDLSPLNDIHIQYKLPNTRTEIVEKNYCAQYNKRFILEHNKREAAKSSNLWSYENNITINAGSEKWWTLSNATMDAWGLVVGETYSIKSFVNNYTKDLAFQILPSWADFRDGRTFVFTNDTQIRIGGNTVASSVTFTPKIMLVKGIDIPDEYQPYSGNPIHKKEFEDFKNSMKFIPYVSDATTNTSEDIETNGTYFVIPTDPSDASIKLEVKAGPEGTLQTAYFSGGIISVYRNYDRRFQMCEAKIVYGAGSTAASTFISDGHNYSSLPSGILTRVTGKCKIYKLN